MEIKMYNNQRTKFTNLGFTLLRKWFYFAHKYI